MDFSGQKILVTGGAGYIGSHTIVQLLDKGADVVLLDNLSNSKREVISRIEKITHRKALFVEGDIRDRALLISLFNQHSFGSIIHFAGLKALGESISRPIEYYDNNVVGSITLIEEMSRAGIKKLIFSSSATVYGDPAIVPITEEFPLKTSNPYGRSKLMVEDILRDLHKADPTWSIALLRYFNPVGAHESGLIGEDPGGVPNNLMPFIAQVAAGKIKKLSVYGSDYNTRDGTGIRDYIHVDDLAKGHLATLGAFTQKGCLMTLNLGTGCGYSVIEMINAFERASGKKIPFEIVGRRPGDVAECYADSTKAKELLGWTAERDINHMCDDLWRWQIKGNL